MRTFKISNFRLFNSAGIRVDFKPVTILTGTNSSGKSSFVKAMMLLKNYLHEVRTEDSKNPAAVQLDFTDQSLKLSGFEDVLNFSCNKGDSINFSIESTSCYAPFDFDVEYSFVASPYSRTKGELKSIKLSHEGELLCQANAENGRISYTFPELKGTLIEVFLIYLKGMIFQYGTQKWTGDCDNPSEYVCTESKSGQDITDWRKYDVEIFHRIDDILRLDKYDMAQAIRKYEETSILFYFPLLDELNSLTKEETIERLKNATDCKEFVSFKDSDGNDMKEIVLSEYMSSNEESFMAFYRSKEDEMLEEFVVKDINDGTLFNSNYLADILVDRMFNKLSAKNWNDSSSIRDESFFTVLCMFMHIWQACVTPDSDPFINRVRYDDYKAFGSYHILPEFYKRYLAEVLSQILMPGSLENLKHVVNSFTPVQRLYSYDDHSSFVDSIKLFRKYSRTYEQNKWKDKKVKDDGTLISRLILRGNNGTLKYKPGTFINKWLKELEIADSLIIEDETDGLGFKLFLEDSKSKRRSSLADQGHGITQLVSILLQIECEILDAKIQKVRGLDADIIPYFAESILAIEEPEVSLHPSMQSKLAMLFEDAAKNGVRLIIETHSEYMVRRTQAYVAGLKSDEEFEKNPFVVYYFNNDGTSYDLEYMKSGRFAKSFGTGFFDEAGKSSIEILRREKEDRG